MSGYSLAPPPADESPDAALIALAMRDDPDTPDAAEVERIMNSPAYISSREDGALSAALLFQTFEDHGAALSDDDVEDMFLGLVMDEAKRMLEAENQPIAAARFAGFCHTIGGCLFAAWKAGTYGE